jgi:hypothetical protein
MGHAEASSICMTTPQGHVAARLLELEQRLKESSTDDAAFQDWCHYAQQLFETSAAGNHRRSHRIHSDATCAVRAGNGRFECRVIDLSLTGVALAGPVFQYVTCGTEVQLDSIRYDGHSVPVTLRGRVTHTREVDGEWVAGVDALNDADPASRRAYFDLAYYPQYQRYLHALADATPRSA